MSFLQVVYKNCTCTKLLSYCYVLCYKSRFVPVMAEPAQYTEAFLQSAATLLPPSRCKQQEQHPSSELPLRKPGLQKPRPCNSQLLALLCNSNNNKIPNQTNPHPTVELERQVKTWKRELNSVELERQR